MEQERGPTVLVVGADGGIGRPLAAAWRAAGARVIGTTRRPDRAGPDVLTLDLARPVAGVALPRVDVAYLLAAVAELAACERDPAGSRLVNEVHPIELARRLAAQGAHVVFTSTNLVFDGRAPFRPAHEPPSPEMEYGRQKARVEAALAALGDGAATLRLTKVIGPATGPFAAWLPALRRGERIEAFADKVLAPVAVDDVVRVLVAIGARRIPGVLQTSAARDISYVEAGAALALRVGARPEQVVAVSGRERGVPASVLPRCSTLDPARLVELLGWSPPDPVVALCEGLGV